MRKVLIKNPAELAEKKEVSAELAAVKRRRALASVLALATGTVVLAPLTAATLISCGKSGDPTSPKDPDQPGNPDNPDNPDDPVIVPKDYSITWAHSDGYDITFTVTDQTGVATEAEIEKIRVVMSAMHDNIQPVIEASYEDGFRKILIENVEGTTYPAGECSGSENSKVVGTDTVAMKAPFLTEAELIDIYYAIREGAVDIDEAVAANTIKKSRVRLADGKAASFGGNDPKVKAPKAFAVAPRQQMKMDSRKAMVVVRNANIRSQRQFS